MPEVKTAIANGTQMRPRISRGTSVPPTTRAKRLPSLHKEMEEVLVSGCSCCDTTEKLQALKKSQKKCMLTRAEEPFQTTSPSQTIYFTK